MVRVLLDACIPRRLAASLADLDVQAATDRGWGDLDNGDLLDAMTSAFDVRVTVDKRLPDQQRLEGRPVAVVVLRARSNRLADLLPLVPVLRMTLARVRPGDSYEVTASSE